MVPKRIGLWLGACLAMVVVAPRGAFAQTSSPYIEPMAEAGPTAEGDFAFVNKCGWAVMGVPFWFSVTMTTWLDGGRAEVDTNEGLGDAFALAEVNGSMGRSQDVTWYCTGQTSFGWYFWHSETHPRREPVRIDVASHDFWYFSWGSYQVRRIYTVMDNHNRAYGYRVPLTEDFDFITNGCGIGAIHTGSATLSGQGQFSDIYGDWDYQHPVLFCVDPMNAGRNCSSLLAQRHVVDNQAVIYRNVEYRCDGATVDQ